MTKYDANANLDELYGYRVVDGKRIPIPDRIGDVNEGRKPTRLDASYGYRQVINGENCQIHVVRGRFDIERYVSIAKPPSDPLVAYRCFRLTDYRIVI